jgi:glycosyltransferase involved in cell wall biosynthesis
MTGLGFAFTAGHWLQSWLQPLVRITGRLLLSRPNSSIIVQNPNDMETLKKVGIIRQGRAILIRGSGVDLHEFPPQPDPSGPLTVAMVSRLLWNKGVGDLVQASRILRSRGITVRVLLIGMPDPDNPTSISEEQLCEWHDDALVQWWGYRDSIVDTWRQAHVAVLPSYREGLPKSLLEAAACARPIVATDVPGCREIVHSGENGFLVPVRDAPSIADALETLLLDGKKRRAMGANSRALVESEFHQDRVVVETLKVYESLLNTDLRPQARPGT